MDFKFGPRRSIVLNIEEELSKGFSPKNTAADEIKHFETFDLIYRSLCAIMYNYVPSSGHPGGSISSGRFVQGILFNTMDYDFSNPDAPDADIISYAAGHKALGLYAAWALRNEVVRIGNPSLLPKDVKYQLRLEDLLGFRRNPTTTTPLFKEHKAKPLDGHPTPATPFIKLSTGASGVGVTSSFGLALGALDYYRDNPPRVHVVEGEGGMTPGRVSEGLAAAGTMGLKNLFLHVDWNQASIDTNAVCRSSKNPGDYVQWDPMELCYLHDWNVIIVPDGLNYRQILAAQEKALTLDNGQPTAIIYRTIKGWKYGIEGKASHGAGHKLCSEGFYEALAPLLREKSGSLPKCEPDKMRCKGGAESAEIEACYWEALKYIRTALETSKETAVSLGNKIAQSKKRLAELRRAPRKDAPRVEVIFDSSRFEPKKVPAELILKDGTSTTLRGVLGDILNYYNKQSGGAIFAAAADLLGSTSTSNISKGFPEGYYNGTKNPNARLLSVGGICEDAISGMLSGLSAFGHHIGVGSSYGAFIAPLGHIASRLHGIGNQSRNAIAPNEKYKTFILTCAHAGLKTGEDGPTHADPQALQLLQENFPPNVMITLTPWDPQEIWPLMTAALQKRPAIIAPFVTRPSEKVHDRTKLRLAPAAEATTGIYALRRADTKSKCDGTIILQESGVTYAFIEQALPKLDKDGLNLNVFYVASAELFDLLPLSEQEKIYPESMAREAMGITGFTFPTMYRFVTSKEGRAATLHPFQKGHYLGSGQADKVLEEAGLDGESQYKAVVKYVKEKKK
jgi:transketolase